MIDKSLAILTSLVVVAGVTSALLPGRQTPGVIREFFSGFNGSLRAATAQR